MNGLKDVVGALRQRFRDGWALLAPGASRNWTKTILTGAVLLALLMLALVRGAQRLVERGELDWETAYLTELVNEGPFSFSTGVWFQTFGSDPTLWILVLLTATIAVWRYRPLAALSILLAYIGPDLITRLGWLSWARPRPEILHDGFASPGFHSFPSGHTAKTLCVYGILTLLWVKSTRSSLERLIAFGILAFLALVVPLGRMSMGVHWPSDVIAGWLIGGAWLIVLALALGWEKRVGGPQKGV